LIDLNELAVKASSEQIELLHRGVQVMVEGIENPEEKEMAVITGLPKRHPDIGRLFIAFRRPNGQLDTIFLGSFNSQIGIKQVEAEAEKMIEQIRLACERIPSKDAKIELAKNYFQNLLANNFPSELSIRVMQAFPMEILQELKNA